MRRSTAPSMMRPPSKRGKFKPPYASDAVKESSSEESTVAMGQCSKHVDRAATIEGRQSGSMSGESSSGTAAYYSVMWCKRSNKKHKTWEGDGICIIQNTVATLKDMEGKDIARASGYRLTELSNLTEGSTLLIGGKEIEVINQLADDEWKTGKCFNRTPPATDTPESIQKSSPSLRKKFSIPSAEGQMFVAKKLVLTEALFSPTAPHALVMPRPSQRHQILYNQFVHPVVEVVADPHLVVHLRPHQREGVTFLYECVMGMRDFAGSGAILADEMGLGKTLQCITVLWTLLKQGPYGRKPVAKKVLILTPGSLVKNWLKEFTKWLGTERLRIFAVSTENRVEEFIAALKLYPVLVISYEMFLRAHALLGEVKFDVMVCDEGHRLKNTSAKTTSLITKLPIKRRILLSGTPIQNDLQEFYAVVEFCNPGVLGSCSSFSRVFETPIVRSRQPNATLEEREIGGKRADELHRTTSLFCLRRTQDVNKEYLPPKVESVVFCRMTALQLQLYHSLLKSRLVKSCLVSSYFSPHLVCINALKKLCNSPELVYHSAVASTSSASATEDLASLYGGVIEQFPSGYETEHEADSAKLLVLGDMLQYIYTHTAEKVVLVSHYTQTLNILGKLCCSIGFKCLRLDGSTACVLRQSIVDRFNSKHSPERVFLLSSKAGGVGLNLIGASKLILYDIDWNPATDLQAMARVWREGQMASVCIYRLITTGTIEEKILQRQICKQELSSVMKFDNDGCKKTMKFTSEDLKDLFTLHESTSCDTHDLLERSRRDGQTSGSDEWKHFCQPIQDTGVEDKLLLAAASGISFVFQKDYL